MILKVLAASSIALEYYKSDVKLKPNLKQTFKHKIKYILKFML
ncbi:hypothetical protein [Campylobacter pinnipediorum]|nr:hypothetical protein [Campylobacter pinnipediorum]